MQVLVFLFPLHDIQFYEYNLQVKHLKSQVPHKGLIESSK
jgi:hypothetical protein